MWVITRPSNRLGSGPREMASGATQPRRGFLRRLSGISPPQVYAIHLPSLDQTGMACTPRMRKASPPMTPVRRNQTPSSSSTPELSRRLLKARSDPSGDQAGLDPSVDRLVSRYGGADPSVGATQISRCRRSLSSTTVVTVNATDVPDGDTAGSETETRR